MPRENQTLLFKLSHLVLWAAIVIGVFVRFSDLGKWPLTTDEYFLGKSVYNLLANGVPRFECGGYYTRGLLQQYLTAPVLLFSSDPEWALRIVPLIFNLLGIPAVYLLGRRLGGFPIACAASVLFCLSIWETEFARFARMYAPFQTLFLWQLVFLNQAIFDKKDSALKWMYGLSTVSLFVYEGAIFVILLNLLPFWKGKQQLTPCHIIINLALLGSAVIFKEIDFRHLGAVPYMPIDVEGLTGRGGGGFSLPLSIPPILLKTLPHYPAWSLIFIFPLALSAMAILHLWRTSEISLTWKLTWLAILVCSLLNLFGLAIELYLIIYLFKKVSVENWETDYKRNFKHGFSTLLISIFGNALFWCTYGLMTAGWMEYIDGKNINIFVGLFKILFNYPDIYDKVIYQWAASMPILTGSILLILVSGLVIVFVNFNKSKEPFVFLLATVINLVLILSFFKTTYSSTRYTFFLYPAFIILSCWTLKELGGYFIQTKTRQIILFYCFVAIFAVISEDFGIKHLKNISAPEVNFRTIYSSALQNVYYPRRDYASPAKYINEHSGENDLVIAFWPVYDFYLKKLDYIYFDCKRSFFPNYSSCQGEREIWTNSYLIYRKDDLFNLIASNESQIWLIMYSDNWKTAEENFLEIKYKEYLAYINIDKTIKVYRIPKTTSDQT